MAFALFAATDDGGSDKFYYEMPLVDVAARRLPILTRVVKRDAAAGLEIA